MSARDRIRAFFIENLNKVVSTHDIAQVAGIRDYQRRIRELRDEEGLQILSHKDRADLKPGEYLLISTKTLPRISRKITAKLRMEILERNGFTCQICGSTARDNDPTNPERKLRIEVDHIVRSNKEGATLQVTYEFFARHVTRREAICSRFQRRQRTSWHE